MPGTGLSQFDHTGFFNDSDRPLTKARVLDQRNVMLANGTGLLANGGTCIPAALLPTPPYPAVPSSLKVIVEVPGNGPGDPAQTRTVDIYLDTGTVFTSVEVYLQGTAGSYTVTIFTVEFGAVPNVPGVSKKTGPYSLV